MCNSLDLLLNDCIHCIIQHLDMPNIISLSETSTKLNKICNKFESIKKYVVNLGFNPYNYFPYYEEGIEKNIKQYMNYEKHYYVYRYKLLPSQLVKKDNKIIKKNKIYTIDMSIDKLKFSFLNNKYKNLNFILKTDKLLVEPIFVYYEIFLNGYILQTTFYDELPILCKHHNVKYINKCKIKNGTYKYEFPIVIGTKYISVGIDSQIIIKMSNDIIIYDTYIKCEVNKYKKYTDEIRPFITTKRNGVFNFVNGLNDISFVSSIYPIKLYFYFENVKDMNVQPFKNLQLLFKDINVNYVNVNYKYEHVKKEMYQNKYHYCLTFIDDTINVFENLDKISKCKINCDFNILFYNSNVKSDTHIVFYTLCYNYFMYAHGSGVMIYSN